MTRYIDTGVLLKLYTEEPESDAVRRWVTRHREPLCFTALHHSECVSALRLKAFRGECGLRETSRATSDIETDVQSGVLRITPVDWGAAWALCREISSEAAAETGCRTLDALHVACAQTLGIRQFVTSDHRQRDLAVRRGFMVPAIRGLTA